MCRAFLAISLALFAFCLIACGGKAVPRGATDKGGKPFATEAEQESRKAAISTLIRDGVIREIDSSRPAVIVTAKFASLDFKVKQNVVAMVANYVFEAPKGGELEDNELLFVVDVKSGNTIGTYSKFGLELK